MEKEHHYTLQITWTGNTGSGTANYAGYLRDHDIEAKGKAVIRCSSDPAFRGDPHRYNPEEMLVASLSSCHMLWYLHLCVNAGIVLTQYTDEPTGYMTEDRNGSGQFREVVLRPVVTVAEADMVKRAKAIHHEVHRYCFIARSVNFPVKVKPVIRAGQ